MVASGNRTLLFLTRKRSIDKNCTLFRLISCVYSIHIQCLPIGIIIDFKIIESNQGDKCFILDNFKYR
ncbi:hypothetical protein QTP88_005949 [Uroleucon formosanum]